MLRKPYLLFLGDARDELAAKTAHGVADWRPEWCLGQLRLPNCKADTGLPDMNVAEAAQKGAKTLLLGIAVSGGRLPESWREIMLDALAKGMDIANGLHTRLEEVPGLSEAAAKHGRTLFNVRHSEQQFFTGKGTKRSGKRLLTVGTDCSCGKKYTALAIEREMRKRGMKADFRATGQTGVLIAERGIAIDAVISDFVSGAAEWLSPDNTADHWDIVEGQGSLFHPAFAGVSLGLLHGTQPDLLVLCHEPTRKHVRGLPGTPIPDVGECIQMNLALAKLTNPACQMAGISINTEALGRAEAERHLKATADKHGLPAVDPIAFGVAPLVDRLT